MLILYFVILVAIHCSRAKLKRKKNEKISGGCLVEDDESIDEKFI